MRGGGDGAARRGARRRSALRKPRRRAGTVCSPTSLAPQRRQCAVIRASPAAQARGDGAQSHIPRAAAETARAVIRASFAAQARGDGVQSSALHSPHRRAGTAHSPSSLAPQRRRRAQSSAPYPPHRRAGTAHSPSSLAPQRRRRAVIRASPAAQAYGDGVQPLISRATAETARSHPRFTRRTGVRGRCTRPFAPRAAAGTLKCR